MNEGPEKPDRTEPIQPGQPPSGTPPSGTPPAPPPSPSAPGTPPPGPPGTPSGQDATQPFQPAPTSPTPVAGEPPPGGSAEFAGTPPTGERRRRPGKIVAIAVIAALVVAGAAYAAVRIFGALAGTEDVLADKVPASSIAYVTAYLDPGASQKLHLKELANKFPALAGRDLTQTVNQALDSMASEAGLSYTRDIQPWLGSQMAVTVVQSGDSSGAVVLIDSEDDDAARQALAKSERAGDTPLKWRSVDHGGVTIRVGEFNVEGIDTALSQRAYAIDDGTVVVGENEQTVGGVIDAMNGDAPTLADDEAYQDTVDALPKSVLGVAYVNMQSVFQALMGATGSAGVTFPSPVPSTASGVGQIQQNPLQTVRALRGFGISLSAEEKGILFDFALTLDTSQLTPEQQALIVGNDDQDNGTIESVPSRAYGVIAFTGLDRLVRGFLDQAGQNPEFARIAQQLDLNSVIEGLNGDASIEVGPGPTQFPGGALLLGTDDEEGMQRFLDRAAAMLLQGGSATPPQMQTETYKDVTIHFAQVPDPELQDAGVQPSYAVANGMGIVATSPDEVKAVIDAQEGSNLESAPTFTEAQAQVPEGSSLFYVDIQSVLQALRPQLEEAFGSTFTALVEPNARPVKAIIITGETDEDVSRGHFFILIE